MIRALTAAAIVVLAAPAPRTLSQPVAVMPFKNLNDDAALSWLSKGIAETMVSDLKRTGKVRVVERDQLDRALTEILLQGAKPAEDSTAAQVGKLVGAKTMVIGSYQKAGSELRINARFVEVETGVVLDSAKTTGPVTKVFALQDEVVDRLLGGEKPAARPARRESEKTVKAYELWTKSLDGSDAERVGLLKASLAEDPEFAYALEDLAALEKRVADYRKAREGAMPGQESVLWERIADAKLTPYERALAVDNLLKLRRDERRYRALLADADKVLAMKLPDPPAGTIAPPHDAALWAKFEAEHELRMRDAAVRSAEKYLKKYPTGFHYKDVEDGLDELIQERRSRDHQLTFYEERMAKIEERRAEEKAKLAGEELAVRMRSLDSERCDVIWRFTLKIWDKLELECRALMDKHAKDPSEYGRYAYIQSRYRVAVALGEQGKFAEAVPIAEELSKLESDEASIRFAKDLLEEDWPRDAKP